MDGQYSAVDADVASIAQKDIDLTLGERLASLCRPTQTVLNTFFWAHQDIRSQRTHDIAGADIEQHLSSGIDMDEAQILVE
jgi:cytidylate kinase